MKRAALTASLIAEHLNTTRFGKKIYAFDRLGSTNSFAKRLARAGAEAGTLVVSEEQTRGRGRLSSHWHSPPGTGLWFTVTFPSAIQRDELGLVPLLAGVSVAQTLEAIGLRPTLKWPNDVLLGGKKVCGILTETEFKFDNLDLLVVGIGLNVNQRAEDFSADIRDKATSLYQIASRPFDRLDLLVSLIQNLENNHGIFSEGGREQLLQGWKQRCPFIGQTITIRNQRSQLNGIFESIDENGHLRLRTSDDKLHVITAGEPLFKETRSHAGGD